MTDTRTRKITEADKANIRTFHCRSAAGAPYVVTGMLQPNDDPADDRMVVRMYSAGCLHGLYEIPAGEVVTSALVDTFPTVTPAKSPALVALAAVVADVPLSHYGRLLDAVAAILDAGESATFYTAVHATLAAELVTP